MKLRDGENQHLREHGRALDGFKDICKAGTWRARVVVWLQMLALAVARDSPDLPSEQMKGKRQSRLGTSKTANLETIGRIAPLA